MASPLPLRPSIDHTPQPRSAIDLTDDASTHVLESLGSETARSIIEALADEPAPVSDLADRVDTSLQNVDYHLQKLRDAGLVTDVGTWYSSKGKEMTVYALTSDRIELRIGTADPSPPSQPEPHHESAVASMTPFKSD